MTKDRDKDTHTSQDYDRKHQQDHILHNPRAAKDNPSLADSKNTGINLDTVDLIIRGHGNTKKLFSRSAYIEGNRLEERDEFIDHFSTRTASDKQ